MTTAAEITATGLFDPSWYLRRYPDIANAGVEPVEHYVGFGQAEGRAPNFYFDEAYYRAVMGDIGSVMPLLHYARAGDSAGIAPGPYFDTAWYRHAYALPRSISALADFFRDRNAGNRIPTPRLYVARYQEPYNSAGPNRDPFEAIITDMRAAKSIPTDTDVISASGLFDANHYLINGSDVHDASLDPIEHFCAYGWQEGRQPNIYFNTSWYLNTNPAVSRLGINPLTHYLLQGERMGRRPVVYFDPVWYRQRYDLPDERSPLAHFLENRRSQRFSPNSEFDLDWYLQRYSKQIGPGRDPFAHYLQVGTYTDAQPAANFDPAMFRRNRMGRRGRHFSWLLHPSRDNPLICYLLERYA